MRCTRGVQPRMGTDLTVRLERWECLEGARCNLQGSADWRAPSFSYDAEPTRRDTLKLGGGVFVFSVFFLFTFA